MKFRTWFPQSKRMSQVFELFDLTVPNGISYLIEVIDGKSFEGVVMLSTNQKDQQNNEIFQGDIVEPGYCQERAEIVFHDAMFMSKDTSLSYEEFLQKEVETYEECMTFLSKDRCSHMLIVGNKYQNHELLK